MWSGLPTVVVVLLRGCDFLTIPTDTNDIVTYNHKLQCWTIYFGHGRMLYTPEQFKKLLEDILYTRDSQCEY
jgi:hypothetical protein